MHGMQSIQTHFVQTAVWHRNWNSCKKYIDTVLFSGYVPLTFMAQHSVVGKDL